MATTQTQISDLVPNPGVLSNVVTKTFKTNNSLTTSGLAVGGPEVDLLMTGGSYIQALNHVNKVDTSTFNYSSDDYDQKGATGKITASPYMAVRHDLNWGWAYTDLVRLVTKYDVHGGLVSAIPMFWSEVGENFAVASMKGALAAAPALTSGDVEDAFDIDALLDAAATMEDPRAPKSLIVSRKTLAKLQKLNKSAYVPASETNTGFASFADYTVRVTDAFGDTTSVIAQDGAFAFGTGVLAGTIGMEIIRDGNGGNGGGGEILRTRLSLVVAPQGFSYKGAAKPGLTGLATAANWTLVDTVDEVGFRAINHA